MKVPHFTCTSHTNFPYIFYKFPHFCFSCSPYISLKLWQLQLRFTHFTYSNLAATYMILFLIATQSKIIIKLYTGPLQAICSHILCVPNDKEIIVPDAPSPKPLADLSSRSALPNLAADTIFIDLVIFWMFFTDLRRTETVQNRIRNVIITL